MTEQTSDLAAARGNDAPEKVRVEADECPQCSADTLFRSGQRVSCESCGYTWEEPES